MHQRGASLFLIYSRRARPERERRGGTRGSASVQLSGLATFIKIHQRGVQWNQGVVICMMLYTCLLCNTTPIHCTPLPLHPPVMNTRISSGPRSLDKKVTATAKAAASRTVTIIIVVLMVALIMTTTTNDNTDTANEFPQAPGGEHEPGGGHQGRHGEGAARGPPLSLLLLISSLLSLSLLLWLLLCIYNMYVCVYIYIYIYTHTHVMYYT